MDSSVTAPSSDSHSLVTQFIVDARDDFVSPTTSVFFNRVHTYRKHVQLLYENLDFDLDGLHKLRKSVKGLHESGLAWNESERELVGALDGLANVNAANALTQDYDPEISAAWLKFCVIFNDLSRLTKGLVQSVKNNLVFPVDNLLKTDLKEKSDLKKPVDKALRDFDAKVARLEKDLKHNSREGANGRLFLSSTDLAEAVLKERTALELEMCKFFHTISKTQSKKGSELLQHLVAFYHTQESFYREGLRTVEEFRCYVDTLIDQLGDINRKQEEERKELRKLGELLETAPCLKDIEKASATQSMYSIHHGIGSKTGSDYLAIGSTPRDYVGQPRVDMDTFSGYLYKRSNRRMHRHWMKRKCEVKKDRFYVCHSNESISPQEINLLTCRVVPHKHEPKEFYVISYERKYHFQAEDETAARHWVALLKRNQDLIQNKTFHSDQSEGASSGQGTHRGQFQSTSQTTSSHQNIQKLMVDRIRSLPGNDRCCDCDSEKDVTWVSTSLGSLHCIDCSGGHRDLGCHVSRIQSLTLDNLETASMLVPLSMGNKAVNEIFEATPNAAREKLSKNSSGSLRKSYITRKYSDKKFLQKLENETTESYLFQSVINGSVKETLHALALGADVNSMHYNQNRSEEFPEPLIFVAIRHDCDGSHLASIQLLVQNGADVNKTNSDGDTAMHLCIRLDKPECLKLVLLSRNADLKQFRLNLSTLASRLARRACEHVLSKAAERDRSILSDVIIPEFLLLSSAQNQSMVMDSDDGSFASSTISMAGSSPRPPINYGASGPPPLPARAKLRILSLHGDDEHDGSLNRSAFNSSRGCETLPGARAVLLPLSSAVSNGVKDATGEELGHGRGDDVMELGKANGGSTSVDMGERPPPPVPPRKVRNVGVGRLKKRCRALHDCPADQPDELSFKANDVIIISREKVPNEDDNWMEGYLEREPEKLGLFPLTFVTFE